MDTIKEYIEYILLIIYANFEELLSAVIMLIIIRAVYVSYKRKVNNRNTIHNHTDSDFSDSEDDDDD